MKLQLSEEIEVDPHTAAWLFDVRDSTYLTRGEIPQAALAARFVEGSSPDYSLSDKGRRIASALYQRSQDAVTRLATLGINATPHVNGVVLPFEVIEEMTRKIT
jgi:hypothetical protein